eukprot:s100_g1.t1
MRQAIVVAKPQEPKVEAAADDLEIATQTARKAAGEDGWKSDFQEAALGLRDFFQDLRTSRHREKGRQATGPLWLHLAAQAKNLADQFNLDQLLEVLKLFCSVRYEDYELYMRLLGEVPHYVKKATTEQLCQLARLLARRRLRERNYVDMVVAHLLHKVRVSEEGLTVRLLVKTANALAALECRSQPKFVEHFNRHFEHRIEELDEEMCCMVSPVFLVNYMSDALRRSFLKRCAEIQAGFSGEWPIRNLACMELALRKEQHSLVASLPSFVVRYLEKVKAQSEFDKWGSVVLPTTVAPDGPRGDDRHELSVALLRKAAGTKGNSTSDVFSSDMHRDVSACLTHLGIEHENGVVTGPYLLDIVAKDMVNPARRIIYEVNSPHHFYEGTKALVADKRLRHRLLGRLGHQLHMVTAADWRPLSAAAKMTFLLKIQQEQQDKHSEEYKQQAAANVNRAPLALRPPAKQREPLKLKSPKDESKAPITVPVPPSLRQQIPQSVTALDHWLLQQGLLNLSISSFMDPQPADIADATLAYSPSPWAPQEWQEGRLRPQPLWMELPTIRAKNLNSVKTQLRRGALCKQQKPVALALLLQLVAGPRPTRTTPAHRHTPSSLIRQENKSVRKSRADEKPEKRPGNVVAVVAVVAVVVARRIAA